MGQRVTLLGDVINTTDRHLYDMSQRVTLLGEVINTTNTPLHMGERATLLGEVITQQIHLYIWPSW